MSYDIFVIFTRYQFQCIQNITKSKNIEKTILITTIPISSEEFKGKIYFFKKITSIKSLLHEIYYRRRKKILLELKITSYQYKHINIFIPHYFNIHSNYISTYLLPDANIHIIPDGILSFYPYQLTKKDIVKQFINKFVASTIGLRYKLFFTNIIDPFRKIEDIYSYDPEITYTYGKKINQIQYTKKSINTLANDNKVVILGTSTKLDNIPELIQKILTLIKEKKINTIYYKMHPSQSSDLIYESLSNHIANLNLLTESIGVENLVEKYDLNIIISVEFSTALLEIQRQYNRQLDCYINNTSIIHNTKYRNYFNKLLKRYNIKELP